MTLTELKTIQDHTRALNIYINLMRKGNNPVKQQWGSYHKANEILNKSESWFKKARFNGTFKEGEDWRRVGPKVVEYNLASVERVKEEMIKTKI